MSVAAKRKLPYQYLQAASFARHFARRKPLVEPGRRLPKQAMGRGIRIDDPPPAVQVDGADSSAVEQTDERSSLGIGCGQGLSHPHKLPDMGQDVSHGFELSRLPATRCDRVEDSPGGV